jgi:hypothetical protein
MKYTRALLVTAIIAALVAGCDDSEPTGPGRTAEDFDWRGAVAPGDMIEIKNVSGNVRASFTSGNEVVVHAVKTSRDSDLASVTIEVVQHERGITICAVYPDVPGFDSNECLPGLQGNMSTADNDVNVEFTLSVPAGVEFVARVIGGDVDAEGLQSDAFVSTVGGDVTVSTSGIAEVTSVYGSLSVAIGRADPGRDLTFRTMYGNVTLRVPSNINARVLAATSSGRIDSDFQLNGTPNHRFGTLGTGGPNLTLSTMGGDVDLQQGPAAQP